MSAYADLRELGVSASARSTSFDANLELLRRSVDPATARRAAVLILFGDLDDKPADFRTAGVPEELDVLLVERAATLNDHPGQVAFPGGSLDAADSGPVAAALREAQEETGLDPAGVVVLGTLPEVGLPVSNFLVTPVLGWWDRPTPVDVVDYGESASVFRVPVADLLNPENRRTAVMTHGSLTHRSPAFLVNGVLVWGFTGIILNGVLQELGWTLPWDEQREIVPEL
ncbi:CoA pyrophosphatase [Arthrobacter gengyunqii]|uniref:CoA pyrophosphatase n=1 Tax=Arthrobacter gengyunqii TaxID=2886940 RepID=A0A9X1S6J9_9MICC|nr:CoA pyrophosphatase [Arthrobacter gengyunqii]MCC3265687.1 CoA pyrophosphatase [Arthrobacter gengyunqii]MCC3268424.1 CoA pyrophosphatase [Arthrobacter gengyunqii]UOY95817.1 CoA pyrophosphatase [Arthrobacter gengyunqii]